MKAIPHQKIDRILELSANAQIRRRGAVKNSPQFHLLTGEITAYGRTLAIFADLDSETDLRIYRREYDASDHISQMSRDSRP